MTPIARPERLPLPDDPSRPGLRLRLDHHPLDEVGQLAHPVDVVAVVDDDADAADLEQVQPARRLEERRRERPQPLADVVEVRAGGPGGRGGGQRVRDVHPRPAAERGGDQVGVQDRHRPRPEAEHDELALGGRLEAEGGAAARVWPSQRS